MVFFFIGCKWVYYWLVLKTDSIQITTEILSLIAKIDEFKGAWRALGTLAPDRLSALRRVATIESIGSSTRIEGSKLSDRQVKQLLSNLEIKSFATRDEQEVAGYAELMDLVFSSWHDIPFNDNYIKQLHQILLQHSEKDAWHRGQYKTNTNSVAAFDEHGQQIGIQSGGFRIGPRFIGGGQQQASLLQPLSYGIQSPNSARRSA